MATPLGDRILYRFIYYIFVLIVELDPQALLTYKNLYCQKTLF